MKKFIYSLGVILTILISCKDSKKEPVVRIEVNCESQLSHGFNLDYYNEVKDTIRSGETFGTILDRYHVEYPRINQVVTAIRDTFDVKNMRLNKSYTILTSKDSIQEAKAFIYKYNDVASMVIDFTDSIPKAYTHRLPIKIVERKVSGTIKDNFSKSLDTIGVRPSLAYQIADIYAATIDFYRLQEGDTFKLIFEEKFINDTTSVGYGKLRAMLFKHKGKELYAFPYVTDTVNNKFGYFDDKGGMMQRQFLKSPIKFQYRISSRYNLRRRIKLYGNKVRPHRGTDFAAPYGTPIMTTASGTVVESARRGGNGNYVKVRHDKTYMTQYLHMKKRKVKVGDYVQQGDVIGWVGLTGNTSGPHVCYRFWKNGVQVDPFKQNLPTAKPMDEKLKPAYLEYIKPLKGQLDEISLTQEEVKIKETQRDSIVN